LARSIVSDNSRLARPSEMAKKKKNTAAATGAEDDDALLDRAIAENAAAQQKAAAAPKPDEAPEVGAPLTMEEALTKLDRVHCFSIATVLSNGSKDACVSADGTLTFYTDERDARAALKEVQALKPESAKALKLELVPLGRAFAVTQGLMGLKAPLPTRLRFSRSVVAVEGDRGVPPALRPRMSGAGPMPLFVSHGLSTDVITPVFLTRDDLAEAWLKRGNDLHDLAQSVVVTDLRVLIARTMQEAAEWKSLVFVPPRANAELAQAIVAQGATERTMAQGFVKGDALLKEVAERVAVEDGDAPPPLV